MLSAVFMLIGSSMVSASDGSSQAMLVNIHVTDSPAKMVIDEIERQTDYLFAYSNAVIDLSHKVSIDAENRPVSEILDRTFANTDISYSMLGVNILLSSKASLGQNPQTPQSSDRVVRGVVRDEAGDPIVGAMVSVKDGTQVAITNSNGAYSINIGAGSDLLFSMLGYTAQSIAIAGRGTIDVTMQENATVLDATIVIGYGTTSARKTVSAISTMSTDKIDQLPYTSTAASLQGRVSGVLVQSAASQDIWFSTFRHK